MKTTKVFITPVNSSAGKWIELDVEKSPSEIEAEIRAILPDGEEDFVVAESECDWMDISGYKSAGQLSNISEVDAAIDSRDYKPEELEAFKIYLGRQGTYILSQQTLDEFESEWIGKYESSEDLGHHLVHEMGYLGKIDKKVSGYLDYESLGRAGNYSEISLPQAPVQLCL